MQEIHSHCQCPDPSAVPRRKRRTFGLMSAFTQSDVEFFGELDGKHKFCMRNTQNVALPSTVFQVEIMKTMNSMKRKSWRLGLQKSCTDWQSLAGTFLMGIVRTKKCPGDCYQKSYLVFEMGRKKVPLFYAEDKPRQDQI